MPDKPSEQPQAPAAAPPPPAAPQPPQAGTPDPYGQPPKSKTGLIIGIVIAAVLLLGGGATALILTLSGDKDTKDNTSTSRQDDEKPAEDEAADEDKLRAANAKTAAYMSDLNAVCEVGSISNAAEFTKPYKVAAFSKANDDRSWATVSLKYDAAYNVKYDEFEKVNAVVCLDEKKDAAVKSTTCEFKSGGETIKIDYYATSYIATLYEAKSGKKVKELGSVSAPASRCPMFASYNKEDPKLIAKPDSAAVDALVAKFIAS